VHAGPDASADPLPAAPDEPSARLAALAAATTFESLTSGAVHAVARHLVDAVGCALGALDSRPAVAARAIATTAVVDQGASVFGSPHATTPEVAAFANTAMVRYLDFNDTGHGAHPSDTMAAVLAVAECRGATGRDVVRAIHAAYEAYAAVRRAGLFGDALRRRHVDQIYASFGSVVGAGVVLGLDAGRMANAISLAITPSVPLRVTRTGVISDWKGCATAHSAMTAVFAARLAQQGLTGPAQPIDGTGGLRDLLGLGPLDLERIGRPRDGPSAVETTALKTYPAEYSAQGPIESILSLRDGVALDQIDRVDVFLHWSGWHEIGGGAGDARDKSAPPTRETADHSLAYVVAVALVDGAVTIDSFDHARRRDAALCRMIAKIGVHEDPKLTAAHAGELPTWPSRVEIRLHDGSVRVRESGPPRGHPARPLSDGEIEAKFFALADRVMPRADSQRLVDTLWQVAALDDIGTLTRQFRGCCRQTPMR
jgi:2-methylcitrate dehydratase